jgi:uncharacterized protein YbjQ (UPF0145 family)
MQAFDINSAEDRKTLGKALLMSLDTLPEPGIVVGDFLVVVVVKAANVVRDIRENIRNLTGGRMLHYERLIQDAVEEAVAELGQKAQDQGYDGVIGLKISHPMVVDGSVEVIVYGNGFRRVG